MKTLVLILTMFFPTFTVVAQVPAKIVFWSGEPNCGLKSRAIKENEKFECGSIRTERGPVSWISHNGINLSVAFVEDGGFHIVGARIKNNSDRVVEFDSDDWGVAHYRDRNEYYSGRKPHAAETSLPSREIIKAMSSELKLKNSLGTFMGDIQMTGKIREIRQEDGSRVKTTVIVPDTDAKIAEARQVAARNEISGEEQREIRKNALTEKSVQPSTSVTGRVYFRTIQDTGYFVFSLSVDGISYVFQLANNSYKQ